jgi:hypothetical protein
MTLINWFVVVVDDQLLLPLSSSNSRFLSISCILQIVFEILVRALIGIEEGDEMQYLRQQFQEFIAGLISLPVKLPGCQLYRSLRVNTRNLIYFGISPILSL